MNDPEAPQYDIFLSAESAVEPPIILIYSIDDTKLSGVGIYISYCTQEMSFALVGKIGGAAQNSFPETSI